MKTLIIIVLAGSVILNVVAVWAYFHYVKYGGSPLGELKRKFTGGSGQKAPSIPYAEDNARIVKEIQDGTADSNRVVFLGASITQRWNFARYLPEFDIINRGVGGQLAPDMLARFKRDVIDLRPRAVVIKFCSINIRPELPLSILKDDMAMMTELAQANGIIPIVSTVIPAGKPEARIGDFSVADTLAEFNRWVKSFADQNNLYIVDLAAALSDEQGFLPRDLSADPVHVNEKGYGLLTETLRPVLDRVLSRSE